MRLHPFTEGVYGSRVFVLTFTPLAQNERRKCVRRRIFPTRPDQMQRPIDRHIRNFYLYQRTACQFIFTYKGRNNGPAKTMLYKFFNGVGIGQFKRGCGLEAARSEKIIKNRTRTGPRFAQDQRPIEQFGNADRLPGQRPGRRPNGHKFVVVKNNRSRQI